MIFRYCLQIREELLSMNIGIEKCRGREMAERTGIGLWLDKSYIQLKVLKRIVYRSRYAKKRIKMIGGGYKLTAEDKMALKKYWEPYGIRPKEYWYTLYCARNGKFDPRYIPDDIWYRSVYPYFNHIIGQTALQDKCFLNTLVPGVKQATTVIKNMDGHFYDENMNLITKEQAVRQCSTLSTWLIKPSTNTGCGNGVQFFEHVEKLGIKNIEKILDDYRMNYIVQLPVEQHPDLARIHEKSLNTIRIQSLFFKEEVYILSAMLRMGNGDSRLDNVSAGGCACVIGKDGWLVGKAVTRKSEWTDHHESGTYFKDVKVPSYDKIIAVVKREHKKMPFFGIIGWDFAVDKEGNPILIEINGTSEPNQIAAGPTFKDITEDVLKEIFIDKTMKDCFIS